jgi:hypothetical protein
LERTRYDSSSDLIRNRAQGYTLRDGELVNDDPLGMSQPYSAGSLLSTGEDLVKWSILLAGGKVVSAESFAMMTTATVLPDGKDTGYGFGLSMDDLEGHPRIQHGGGIHGFNSMLLWLPDDAIAVAVISNGEPVRSGKIADEIALAAMGIERVAAKDIAIPPDLMKRIVGTYALEDMSMNAKVWDEGGKAMLQATAEGQGSFALQWQGTEVNGGNEFRASFDNTVKLVFAADGQSFTLFQGGGQVMAQRVKE